MICSWYFASWSWSWALGSSGKFIRHEIKVLSWINAVLGLWVLLAPFILSCSKTTGAMVNDLIVGITVVIFGIWAAVVGGKSAA